MQSNKLPKPSAPSTEFSPYVSLIYYIDRYVVGHIRVLPSNIRYDIKKYYLYLEHCVHFALAKSTHFNTN